MTWNEDQEERARRRYVEEGVRNRPPILAPPLIFLGMWLSGWACSSFLLSLGLTSIPARYAIAAVVSYGVFIALVGVWCRIEARRDKRTRPSDWDFGALDLPTNADAGEGCLVVLAIAALGLLLSGLFYLVGGYALLFEVAFESVFAGTVVWRLRQRQTLGDWSGRLIRRTWWPALVATVLLVAAGFRLQRDHPEAQTLAQAVRAYRANPSPPPAKP